MKRGHITQVKPNRDAVRAGTLLPELYGKVERIYRRHGLPGLAIWAHNRDADLTEEMDDVDAKVERAREATTLLLAFRIQNDGHAKTLGDAASIAEDMDQVRELYPDAFR